MGSWVRRLAAAAAALGLVAGSLSTHAAITSAAHPASLGTVTNPYSPAYGHPYRHGVVPTVERYRQMQAYEQAHPSSPAVTGPNTLSFGGGIDGIGVTSGTPKIYLVFWGTQWGTSSTNSNGNLTFSGDPAGAAPYLQQLFKGLGTGNELWSGTMTQYCDGSSVASGATSCPSGAPHVGYPTGGALAGVWYDNSAAAPSSATGHQIGVEAVNAAAHFGNTTAASNRYAQYDILSPHGTNPDNYQGQGFCAWHDYNGDSTLSGGGVSSPYGDIAFSNMPYVSDAGAGCGQNFVNSGSAGTLDGFSIVNGHEYAETVTDQNPAGGWTNATSGAENGDECAWISPGSGQGASANVTMGTGSFAMQSTWSNDTNRCDISHAIVGGSSSNNFSISASPTSLSIAQGGSGTSTISTAVTSGSAATVSLSASVSPSGPTASLSPTSVTAGSSSTLTVSVGSSVATGSYTVTVTGTEGSVSHTTTVTVTVTSASSNNFSISASPSTLSIAQGSSGTSTIGTTVTSGSAQTVNLSVSGVPSGATASFNPTSVTAGSSSTLTINTGTAAAGTYTLTVTGTGTSATHSTTVSLTVTSSGGGSGITNGGFETGTFSGWTTSGAATSVVTTLVHSGTYAAQGGSTSPTNGDSSISQTFTVPSGNNTLTFYYDVVCPDTVTYDWATATLKDNTAGTTTTPLGKTCVSNSGWVKVSAAVTAGHSYTLTLTSHDDNYSGDPTYTHFDDVSLTGTAPPPVGITNGGFETGNFSGWTTSGTTSIISGVAHTGTYAGQGGSTSPTNGDSSISQTFTAPSGASKVTFWYDVVCPDTVTYDWATATLKDNTAGTTSTPLAKTCVSNSGWQQVTVSITAGHSYTLTLTSHDDNYPGDPTYTNFDDASTS